MNKRRIPTPGWFLIVLFTSFLEMSALADLQSEIKDQGLLCEDRLDFCDFFERDHKLLFQKGPGSYFFRNFNHHILILYLGTDGLLRIDNLKYQTDSSLHSLTARLAHILKHPIKTESFCGTGVETSPHTRNSTPPLTNTSTATTTSPSARPIERDSDQAPFFCHQDAVFDKDGILKVKGPAFYEEDAQEKSQRELDLLHFKQKQLHGAQLFHGSTSASLTAFTEYNGKAGSLLPLGILENEKKKIAFSGEIVWGRTGVNATSLSTTWLGELKGAMVYSSSQGWSPSIGKKLNAEASESIKEIVKNFLQIKELDAALLHRFKKTSKLALKTGDFSELKTILRELKSELDELPQYEGTFGIRTLTAGINSREVNEKRLIEWPLLTKTEKDLITKPFPVLYGIRSDREEDIKPVFAAIQGEIAIKGGAHAGEIRVIFVPVENVEFVKKVLSENGHRTLAVEPLPSKEKVKKKFNFNFKEG
ncbi:MAG: hypothetical protein ABIQ95_12800 [Bdellovibrionia bacterium]